MYVSLKKNSGMLSVTNYLHKNTRGKNKHRILILSLKHTVHFPDTFQNILVTQADMLSNLLDEE